MFRTSSSTTTNTMFAATRRPTLAKDAKYLSSHPDAKILIGGYCDERGSNEYNLALGQNRADSAKKALVDAGVAASRIRVISYGKEKPFCTESMRLAGRRTVVPDFRWTAKTSINQLVHFCAKEVTLTRFAATQSLQGGCSALSLYD